MPDVNKKQLSVFIPLTLYANLLEYAEKTGLTVSEVVQIALQREYGAFPATSKKLFWIAEQTARNENRRKQKGAK